MVTGDGTRIIPFVVVAPFLLHALPEPEPQGGTLLFQNADTVVFLASQASFSWAVQLQRQIVFHCFQQFQVQAWSSRLMQALGQSSIQLATLSLPSTTIFLQFTPLSRFLHIVVSRGSSSTLLQNSVSTQACQICQSLPVLPPETSAPSAPSAQLTLCSHINQTYKNLISLWGPWGKIIKALVKCC